MPDSQLEALHNSLTNHTPSSELIEVIESFREAAKEFALELCNSLPTSCRERSLAITHLEDCVMWLVKGIILHGEGVVLDA